MAGNTNKNIINRILDDFDQSEQRLKSSSFNKQNYKLDKEVVQIPINQQVQPEVQYKKPEPVLYAEKSNVDLVINQKKPQQIITPKHHQQDDVIYRNIPPVQQNIPQPHSSSLTTPSISSDQIKIKKEINNLSLSEINRNTIVHLLSKQDKQFSKSFRIKIIGIGGAGNNIVKYMVNHHDWPDFVDIIALNTDYVALSNLGGKLRNIFILGAEELNGNGSGGNPEVGRSAAEADIETIKTLLLDTDVLILVAGLGKGTGTGATPVIAKIAQEMNILTIGMFNLPSIGAEGEKTYANAIQGLRKLSTCCNGLTTVNNDKIINTDKEKMSIKKAYEGANKYIKVIVQEIINIITVASDINVDFADVKNFFEANNGFLFLRINSTDYTKDGLKQSIEDAIKTGFTELNIKQSEKALINFKLNENVPSFILENTRSALKDIVNSGNVNIVHGVAYNDLFEDAQINILLTGQFVLDGAIDEAFLDVDEEKEELDFEEEEEEEIIEQPSPKSIHQTLKNMDHKKNNPLYSNTYKIFEETKVNNNGTVYEPYNQGFTQPLYTQQYQQQPQAPTNPYKQQFQQHKNPNEGPYMDQSAYASTLKALNNDQLDQSSVSFSDYDQPYPRTYQNTPPAYFQKPYEEQKTKKRGFFARLFGWDK